jgi:hypothetical protein
LKSQLAWAPRMVQTEKGIVSDRETSASQW